MLLLGHVGCTLAGVRAARSDADPRAAALLALLPDLVDKPVRELLPGLVNHSTRSFGHSLVGAALVLAALLALRRRLRAPVALWGCFAGHLLLDRVWLNGGAATLLWPLLGPFPRPVRDLELELPLLRYNLAGEALGLALLLAVAWRRRRVRP